MGYIFANWIDSVDANGEGPGGSTERRGDGWGGVSDIGSSVNQNGSRPVVLDMVNRTGIGKVGVCVDRKGVTTWAQLFSSGPYRSPTVLGARRHQAKRRPSPSVLSSSLESARFCVLTISRTASRTATGESRSRVTQPTRTSLYSHRHTNRSRSDPVGWRVDLEVGRRRRDRPACEDVASRRAVVER